MFIDMVAMQMVKMAVMEIIGVVVMGDSRMPAVRSVLVGVMLMDGVGIHRGTPFVSKDSFDFILPV